MKHLLDKIKSYLFSDKTTKSAIINVMLKPISIILGLIYTPLLLSYLGDTQYGLWSTVLSIISWVNYCDVGIGHGLRNLLAKEFAEKQYEKAKSTITTAYIILTTISFILLCISIISVFTVNWHKVFNTEIDMTLPLGISFVFICINFVLALSNNVLYALQLAEQVSVRNCLTQLLNIVGILLLMKYSSGSLVLISILFGATTTVIYICTSVKLIIERKELRPSISFFNKDKINEIANIGVKFFIIQVACIALYTVDNLLITNLFGGAAVTPFNITYKAFNTLYSFLIALCAPFWSMTTKAFTTGDIQWIKQARKKLNFAACLFIFAFILLAVVFKPLAYIWIGRSLDYPVALVVVMCVYYCLYTIVTVNVQIINGTGLINFQLVLMVLMGIANIPFSIFLAKTCGLGIVGIRLATTILMGIGAIAFPLNLNFILKKYQIEKGE